MEILTRANFARCLNGAVVAAGVSGIFGIADPKVTAVSRSVATLAWGFFTTNSWLAIDSMNAFSLAQAFSNFGAIAVLSINLVSCAAGSVFCGVKAGELLDPKLNYIAVISAMGISYLFEKTIDFLLSTPSIPDTSTKTPA